MTNKLNKKVKFSRVLNIVLVVVLVGVIAFGWWYLTKQNPVDAISKITAPSAPQPSFLYSIYGSDATNLNKPSNTTVFANKVYVADLKNGRIAVFSYDGKYQSEFGKNGNGKLQLPAAMKVVDNEIYVADAGTGKIHVFNMNGQFQRYFGEKVLKFPTSIDYKDNKFYILDSAGFKVRILDKTGKELKSFGKEGGEKGAFYQPYSITIGPDNRLYVADSNNNRLQVFDLEGKLLEVVSGVDLKGQGGFSIPRGVAFDRAGNIYTTEGMSGDVAIANPQGKVIARFGFAEPTKDETGEQDMMRLPTSVFIDDNQRIYVTEYARSRVLVYELK